MPMARQRNVDVRRKTRGEEPAESEQPKAEDQSFYHLPRPFCPLVRNTLSWTLRICNTMETWQFVRISWEFRR